MVIALSVYEFIETIAYFYVDDVSRRGFLVDPGAEPDKLLSVIEEKNIVLEKILLTHGHFDHMGAADVLRQKLNIPVCMRQKGKDYVENPGLNLSMQTGRTITLKDVVFLSDYSTIALKGGNEISLRVIPVEGHTEDGAVYYDEKNAIAFVGDSIFRNSYGATHFPGGDEIKLLRDIKEKILSLPDNTVLLSGHSEPTTVGEEKMRPWFA